MEFSETPDESRCHAGIRGVSWRAINRKKLYGWRSKIKDYSIILGAGIHMIDLIMWLTNSKPISVYATGNNNSTKGTRFKKNE